MTFKVGYKKKLLKSKRKMENAKLVDNWVLKLKNDILFTEGATYTVYLRPLNPPLEELIEKILKKAKRETGKDVFWNKSRKMFYYGPF